MQRITPVLTAILMAVAIAPANAADLSAIMIPINVPGTYNQRQLYVGNRASTARWIDGVNIRRTSGSHYIFGYYFAMSSHLGSGWNNAPSNISSNFYSTSAGALNWSSNKEIASYGRTQIGGLYTFWNGTSEVVPVAGEWEIGFRSSTSSGGTYAVEYTKQLCVAVEGDANLDGVVDSTDAVICANSYNHGPAVSGDSNNPTWTLCDFDGDGVVEYPYELYAPDSNSGKVCHPTGSGGGRYCDPDGTDCL